MELRIGIVQAMKEIELEMADDSRAATQTAVETALSGDSVLWLTDKRGRTVGIPAARIAYVDFGSSNSERRVGFGHS
jgi:hypothetical protein